MEVKNILKEQTIKILEQEGYLLIDFIIRGTSQNAVIEIFIDGADFVKTEDCERVSRQIKNFIEEKELYKNKYRLEVSSPGLDRPLKFLIQYKKNIGRSFNLSYKNAEGNTINTEAVLKEVNESILVFNTDKEEIKIEFNNINSAKVQISF